MSNKKVALIILDGVGFDPNQKLGNVVNVANIPTIRNLLANYPFSQLQASGPAVGLPKGQMGNSEVGHLSIGAGRLPLTGLSQINFEVDNKNFLKNKSFLKAIDFAKKNNSKLHIMGLYSNGGVHSSINHINELLLLANDNKVNTVIHCFSDGRDVGVNDFIKDLKNLLAFIKDKPFIKICTISGRYYAMDRDQRWERIEQAYQCLLLNSEQTFKDPIEYVKSQYDTGKTDEFILPAYNANVDKKSIVLSEKDAIIFANFRPDRARQLCHMLKKTTYYDYKNNKPINSLYLVSMSKYEGTIVDDIAYPPREFKNTLGEVIANKNLSQLRIAETEKYAHVTFFLDGGKEINFPHEQKILLPSPKVATYDLKPEMAANEITSKLVDCLGKFDLIICNYANGDMVGHTGNIKAAITSLETVDSCLEQVIKQAQKTNTTLFITADHGNCDQMLDAKNEVVTSHTLAPVFFVSTDKSLKLSNGSLINIAPTILKYLNIDIPKEMTEKPLF